MFNKKPNISLSINQKGKMNSKLIIFLSKKTVCIERRLHSACIIYKNLVTSNWSNESYSP